MTESLFFFYSKTLAVFVPQHAGLSMSTRRELVVTEEKKKRTSLIIHGVATLLGSGLLFNVLWLLGLVALGVGGALTYRKYKEWFAYRAENGMRF